MSASSKKKLRKEAEAAKLTERQQAARAEAKKTKVYTIAFVAVMVLLLVVAIVVGVTRTIANSGLREKNTVAVTLGDHKVSNAELNYFFVDAVNQYYSSNGSYAAYFGLNVSAPLDQQVLDETTGETWADNFLNTAKNNARSVYALCDAAAEAGYTLPEAQAKNIETALLNVELYAAMYGYSDGESYLKAMYGPGASEKGYEAYCSKTALANSYLAAYADSLTYDDAALRAKESENFAAYSSYTYNTYYLAASRFLEGGTVGEDGNTTYSQEEKDASVAAAEEAAKSLTGEEITSLEALDAAIAALPVNAESTSAATTAYTDTLYSSVSSVYSEWLTAEERKEGDLTYIASTSTTTDENGTETTTVNGYYVIYFIGANDNTFPLANVRHILVAFEGGVTDSATGAVVYSDQEKAFAKTEADDILAQWLAGDATEDSFAALANEKSADGDGTTGGLYEDIYPGQMVVNFNDWCFAEGRKAGDYGIVESEYGYHVMYYVGDSDLTYRDYQIENILRNADLEAWNTALVEAVTVTDGSYAYITTGMKMAAN